MKMGAHLKRMPAKAAIRKAQNIATSMRGIFLRRRLRHLIVLILSYG